MKAISAQKLLELLKRSEFRHIAGVPDSLLAGLIRVIDGDSGFLHDRAVDEGQAVALAIGSYISTGTPSIVYLQNSGLGHALNPLTSLADKNVFGVPMLLMIGWRGEPGIPDEPQHLRDGDSLLDILRSIDMPFVVMSGEESHDIQLVNQAIDDMRKLNQPVAVIVRKGTITNQESNDDRDDETAKLELSRELAIKMIADNLLPNARVVATTGKASRELFEYYEQKHSKHENTLLVVGGMGHASSIGFSIARLNPEKNIYVVDGDGALFMHMGALPYIARSKLNNLFHIVINNGEYESVGGQKVAVSDVDLLAIARASGYSVVHSVSTKLGLQRILKQAGGIRHGTTFIEVKVKPGSRLSLGRPTKSPLDSILDFMENL